MPTAHAAGPTLILTTITMDITITTPILYYYYYCYYCYYYYYYCYYYYYYYYYYCY